MHKEYMQIIYIYTQILYLNIHPTYIQIISTQNKYLYIHKSYIYISIVQTIIHPYTKIIYMHIIYIHILYTVYTHPTYIQIIYKQIQYPHIPIQNIHKISTRTQIQYLLYKPYIQIHKSIPHPPKSIPLYSTNTMLQYTYIYMSLNLYLCFSPLIFIRQ